MKSDDLTTGVPGTPNVPRAAVGGGNASLVGVVGWAAYLACSWTWCIGMFLPVLLIRDFGLWGFVVFAVPNVVGAAAMGWVLTRQGAEAVRTHHVWAVRAFSLVTVLFQTAFAIEVLHWLVQFRVDQREWAGLLPLLGLALVVVGSARVRPVTAACAAWLFSAGLFVAFALVGDGHSWPPLPSELPAGHVLALAPVCVLGFVLCPYLDATFLRARVESSRPRIAFGLGFGVAFPPMLLFTLLYTGVFHDLAFKLITLALVFSHMLVQLGFTIGVHTGELWRLRRGRRSSLWQVAAVLVAVVLFLLVAFPALGRCKCEGQVEIEQGEEFLYRLFLSFYGLVFPAYVWVCMIPRRVRGSADTTPRRAPIAPPTRVSLFACATAIAIASPCYWLGFIERQTWWLLPGVAIVLLARYCVPSPREKIVSPALQGSTSN